MFIQVSPCKAIILTNNFVHAITNFPITVRHKILMEKILTNLMNFQFFPIVSIAMYSHAHFNGQKKVVM